jgi:hypothetical protein
MVFSLVAVDHQKGSSRVGAAFLFPCPPGVSRIFSESNTMKHDPSLNPHNHPYVLFQTGKGWNPDSKRWNGAEETSQLFYATLQEAIHFRDMFANMGNHSAQRIEDIRNPGVELGIVTRPVGRSW